MASLGNTGTRQRDNRAIQDLIIMIGSAGYYTNTILADRHVGGGMLKRIILRIFLASKFIVEVFCDL